MGSKELPSRSVVGRIPRVPEVFLPDELDLDVGVRTACGVIPRGVWVRRSIQAQRLVVLQLSTSILLHPIVKGFIYGGDIELLARISRPAVVAGRYVRIECAMPFLHRDWRHRGPG